jgi:hypothetical protein
VEVFAASPGKNFPAPAIAAQREPVAEKSAGSLFPPPQKIDV